MSADEYCKLMRGEVLENHSTHPYHLTTSVGFCFTTEKPEKAIHRLSGQVDVDYCVTMEPREGLLREAKAFCRDTSVELPKHTLLDAKEHHRVMMTEYCTERYSLADVKIVNVSRKFAGLPSVKEVQALMGLLGYKPTIVDKSQLYG